jgi:hypothetical protein
MNLNEKHEVIKLTGRNEFHIPDINKSEYCKLAKAVIHLGVRIIPSDSECTS